MTIRAGARLDATDFVYTGHMVTSCAVEGCEKPRLGQHRLCSMHRSRKARYGSVEYIGSKGGFRWSKGEDITYTAAHYRVKHARGKASDHTCPCGERAFEWAYDHKDPDEKRDPKGRPYSIHPHHYAPMCRRCHRKADYHREKVTL